MRSGKVKVGHPVDVATGVLFQEAEDFFLSGRVPLPFRRRYSTALLTGAAGMFGRGWFSPFEMHVRESIDGCYLLGSDGETQIDFEEPASASAGGDGITRNLGAFHELTRKGPDILVTSWSPGNDEVVRYIFRSRRESLVAPLVSVEDVAGNAVDIGRDENGRITTLVQRRERRGVQLAYDAAGHVAEIYFLCEGELGPLLARYTYNPNGLLTGHTDSLLQHTTYVYDGAGRMIAEINPAGMQYSFSYDLRGRCIESTGAGRFGHVELEFDEAASVTRVTDALGNTTRFEFNSSGQVVRQVAPAGGEMATAYDEHGRLVREVMPTGAAFEYSYDDRGDLTETVSPLGLSTRYSYNDHHQVAAVTDPAGAVWRREFDRKIRVVRVESPGGESMAYSYNDAGDLRAITEPSGHARTFEWSSRGELIAESDPLGNRTEYIYDQLGFLTGVVDAAGNRTEAEVDPLGRVNLIRFPDSSTRRYGWNAYDQITSFVDERGGVHRWTYSPCGVLTAWTAAGGGSLQYEWSAVPGILLSVTNERGERHNYEYDADGLVIRETDFAGATTSYGRDPDGQITEIRDSAGNTATLTRNAAGAIVEARYSDGMRIAYEYDERGLLLRADNGVCPVERAFDTDGRLLFEKQGLHTVTNDYHKAARIRRRSSLGDDTVFEWNENGDLGRLLTSERAILERAFDALRNEISRSLPGGVRVVSRYDTRGRCRGQEILEASPRRSAGKQSYDYDSASNVVSIRNGVAAQFEYDSGGHIVLARTTARTEEYEYDAAGNLTRRKIPSASGFALEEFEYGSGNRLRKRGQTTYDYDAVGRLILKSEPAGKTEYRWNARGELVGVELPDGSQWTYVYDAFGRRVRKLGPNRAVEYVWDGDVLLHEHDAGSKSLSTWEFAPGGFSPWLKRQTGRAFLCVNDPAGAPWALLEPSGVPAWSARPWPPGETAKGDPALCPIRFQGQMSDPETGLAYNRFRYYDPETGRYISADPVGLIAGPNVYAYGPNPLAWIDPYGLTTVTCYRFADRNNPGTLKSRLSRANWFTRMRVNFMMRFKWYREWRADRHMRGYVENSPFVSLGTDPSRLASSPDPWLSTIATGRPGAPGVARAPDIGQFSVPDSRLVNPRADNALSIHEGEILYHGDDLGNHLTGWQTNPY
jgi:RHS repeat-associated protein